MSKNYEGLQYVIFSSIPSYRWEDNIQIDLKEMGCDSVDWIYLTEDRDQWWTLVNMVMSLQIP